MQIAQVLAGYSLGDADNLRRAMGKKKAEKMAKERERFIDGASRQGRGREAGGRDLRPDGDLRRVRLQQVALGRLRADLLPDRLPEGALPGGVHGRPADAGDERHRQDLQEHRRVPRARHPHPAARREREPRGLHRDASSRTTTACGRSASVSARCAASAPRRSRRSSRRATTDGPVRFAGRLLQAHAGAAGQQEGRRGLDQVRRLRFLRRSRAAALLEGLDRAVQWATAAARAADDATRWVCSAPDGGRGAASRRCPTCAPWTDREMLSGRARGARLLHYRPPARQVRARPAQVHQRRGRLSCAAAPDQGKVSVGGVIQGLRLRNSRKGDRYASFTLEDKTGTVEVICWPETYRKLADRSRHRRAGVRHRHPGGGRGALSDHRRRGDPARRGARPPGPAGALRAARRARRRRRRCASCAAPWSSLPATARPSSTCCCPTGPRPSSPSPTSCAWPPPTRWSKPSRSSSAPASPPSSRRGRRAGRPATRWRALGIRDLEFGAHDATGLTAAPSGAMVAAIANRAAQS